MKVWKLFIICAIFAVTLACFITYSPDKLFKYLTLFSLGTVFAGLFITVIVLIIKNWNKDLSEI